MSEPSIPITRPFFDSREERNLRRVLASGWVSQGEWTAELERLFAAYTGARRAVAANSCTSLQMLAARAIGLGPGDEAVVPAFTWISTANSVEWLGARPELCDIDLETFNLDPEEMEARLSSHTRAILPVHLFGYPAPMGRVMEAAGRRNLTVIEDCACSLGASLGGRHTGTFGLCGCFSLHPRKSITTGEGGVLVTDDCDLAARIVSLRSHGASVSDLARHRSGGFLLPEHTALGFNFRLTDLQAAVGVAQFAKLGRILGQRERLAERYLRKLAGLPNIRPPSRPAGGRHGWQAFVCLVGPPGVETAGKKEIDRWHRRRNRVMQRMAADGVATRQGTHAVHLQAYYRRRYGWEPMDFPRAYAADRLSLALPLFAGMTVRQQDRVVAALASALGKAG